MIVIMTAMMMTMVFTVTFCVFADFTTGGDGFDGGPWGEITLIGPDCPMMMWKMIIIVICIIVVIMIYEYIHFYASAKYKRASL